MDRELSDGFPVVGAVLAADYLPPVWLPDERTRARRRQGGRRARLVRQRTRIKNQARMHSVPLMDVVLGSG